MNDVRGIANFVLAIAEKLGREVSNLQMNKIVFFLHADYLAEFSRPLVNAKIEAWTYGPVFREIYREFKAYGSEPIAAPARKIDPVSGHQIEVTWSLSGEEEMFLSALVERYVMMSASALVSYSHVENGPWDKVWNHESIANASMRISDEAIKSWYTRTTKH